MSEWDCKHGRSDDAQTPRPICERDRKKDARIDRLPKWAKELIRSQARTIEELHRANRQINVVDCKPNVIVECYPAEILLHADSVHFLLPSGHQLRVRITDDGACDVNADRRLLIDPRSSNSIRLQETDF